MQLFYLVHVLYATYSLKITGTLLCKARQARALVIIFHLLQFLNYSKRDTRQSCKLANTSADVLDGF